MWVLINNRGYRSIDRPIKKKREIKFSFFWAARVTRNTLSRCCRWYSAAVRPGFPARPNCLFRRSAFPLLFFRCSGFGGRSCRFSGAEILKKPLSQNKISKIAVRDIRPERLFFNVFLNFVRAGFPAWTTVVAPSFRRDERPLSRKLGLNAQQAG